MTDPKRALGDDESVSAIFRSSFPVEADGDGFRTRAWSAGAALLKSAPLKPLYPTLLHALSAAAKLASDQGIRLLADDEDEPETFLSYAELYRRVVQAAGGLQQKGFKRGDRALLVMPTSFEFFIAFFAIQAAGGIPVPSYPPAALEKVELALDRLKHVASHAEVKICLATKTLLPLLGDLAKVPSLQHLLTLESLPAAKMPKVVARSDDPAFIQYTSGSTGRPKGVLLTHKNLAANLHATGQAAQINRHDVVVSWLPQYHDMGLIGGMLFSVYWRIPLVLMSPTAFLMRPVRWLQAISKYKGTLSSAPNFAYGLCVKRVRPRDLEGLDLSSWRLALNGAEPVNVQTVREFTAKFAPVGFKGSTMYPVYGLAESTVGVTFPDLHETTPVAKSGQKLAEWVRYLVVDRRALAAGRVEVREGPGCVSVVSVGRPLPGHEISVVDDRGRPVAERVVGHVVVRGPSVMKGYFRDQEATDKVLRHDSLWTGDLGFIDSGELFVAGRAKDLIILRGKNFYAEDLEHLAEQIDGARPSGVVAFGIYDEEKASDLVVMVCETKLEDEVARTTLAQAITEAVSAHAGVTLDEVVLVPPGTIPKTSSGKRQRGLTRQAYLDQTLVPKKTGKLKLALVFVRSGAGRLSLWSKRFGQRREPD